MKLRWLIPLALLLPMKSFAIVDQHGRVTTLAIQPGSITSVHLRPGFESIIHLPEEVTSVVVGDPASFHVEHSEAEPAFVYVKPIVHTPTQSDLLIAMKSGEHVVLDLISDDDAASPMTPIDYLLEYKPRKSFVVYAGLSSPDHPDLMPHTTDAASVGVRDSSSPVELQLAFQRSINTPTWTTWQGRQFQTSLGDIRQLGSQMVVAFSVLNSSDHPLEILAPQIQMDGHKPKKTKGRNILSDQIEVRNYRLTSTRLEPGTRADGVLVFDRPNFKSSTDTLFLQLAQADQVDHPVLIRLPFTPPFVASTTH